MEELRGIEEMKDRTEEVLVRESLVGFLGKLGSAEPTPGGGAAAALVSALGGSRRMMVAKHTLGKPKFQDVEKFNIDARAKAEELRAGLTAGVDADAEAFKLVSTAYALPKTQTDIRDEAIGKASIEAAAAPLDVMKASLEGLKLAQEMIGRSNKNLESDIHVAIQCFRAGLVSASYNVKANLSGIRKLDPARAESFASELENLLLESEQLTTGK